MQISLPEVLLNPKNKESWEFDGWKAVAHPEAPEEVKTACEEHNKFVMETVEIDEDDED